MYGYKNGENRKTTVVAVVLSIQSDRMFISLSLKGFAFFLGLEVSIASAVISPTLIPNINPFIAHLL